MSREKLSSAQIKSALEQLDGWTIENGKLHKEFKFKNFAQALGWMVSVGVEADKMDHHPEWSNVYSRVTVDLVTHDLDNAISNLDVELAQKMDKLSSR